MKHRNIVAILCDIDPSKAADVAKTLVDAGITRIQVPVNSPNPIKSISAMIQSLGSKAVVGAGSVLDRQDVDGLKIIGGEFVMSPNCDAEIIAITKQLGLASWPGAFTPSECFTALRAGADGLCIAPATMVGVTGFKELRKLLPDEVPLYAVGGIKASDFKKYVKAGCSGFCLGSSIYKPSWTLSKIADKAAAIVDAHDEVFEGF